MTRVKESKKEEACQAKSMMPMTKAWSRSQKKKKRRIKAMSNMKLMGKEAHLVEGYTG
jgi:hypothetical protein